jgi:hypothetical protein|nr:MAG TPA: hypothetical protein [Caudoviricetes sp.]
MIFRFNQIKTEMNNPKYYYSRHMGSYKLYKDNGNGTATKINQNWDEETIRKQCYELNGWKYKPKKK